MVRLRRRQRIDSSVKMLGLLALMGRTTVGQEGAGAEWNPRETGELALNWKNGLIGPLLALVCCGLWKLLMWLLESRRAGVDWKRARIWWPSAMLVWGWVLVILLAGSELGGLALEAFVLVFALINFPVLVVMGIPLAVLDRTVHPAVWVNLLVGSLTMWSGNYFFARWAEWRAWLNVPVSLHLADPASDRATGVRS